MASAKIVGQQRPPTGAETYPPMKVLVQPKNLVDIQSIRRNQPLPA
jgi:hypothetical protein